METSLKPDSNLFTFVTQYVHSSRNLVLIYPIWDPLCLNCWVQIHINFSIYEPILCIFMVSSKFWFFKKLSCSISSLIYSYFILWISGSPSFSSVRVSTFVIAHFLSDFLQRWIFRSLVSWPRIWISFYTFFWYWTKYEKTWSSLHHKFRSTNWHRFSFTSSLWPSTSESFQCISLILSIIIHDLDLIILLCWFYHITLKCIRFYCISLLVCSNTLFCRCLYFNDKILFVFLI